jgi:hypothetical protein
MIVDEILVDRRGKQCFLSARVATGPRKREFRLFYGYPLEFAKWVRPCADPFLAALLLPAMRLGNTLSVEAKASKKLLSALPQIMTLFTTFDKSLRPIEIDVVGTEEKRSVSDQKRSALFFSGGLDSFYSLIRLKKSNQSLSHLILVNGFDIPLGDATLYNTTYAAARDVARNFGKTLVPVSSNLKRLLDPYVEFGFAFGSALASIGLSLQGLFRRVYIASDLPNVLYPVGSRPDLDPLWSTESTTFVHHGYETVKREKGKVVAHNLLAQKYLRVCWENWNGAYNCGRCMKCVLTMVELHLAGVLPKFNAVFPTKLSPDLIRRARLDPDSDLIRYFIKTETAGLLEIGEMELANALAYAVAISKLKQRIIIAPLLKLRKMVPVSVPFKLIRRIHKL